MKKSVLVVISLLVCIMWNGNPVLCAEPVVIGKTKFNDGHQVIYGNDPTKTAAACVAQWREDGKRVIVFPTSVADGKIQLPDWVKTKK